VTQPAWTSSWFWTVLPLDLERTSQRQVSSETQEQNTAKPLLQYEPGGQNNYMYLHYFSVKIIKYTTHYIYLDIILVSK
jgi:hypothetical protein